MSFQHHCGAFLGRVAAQNMSQFLMPLFCLLLLLHFSKAFTYELKGRNLLQPTQVSRGWRAGAHGPPSTTIGTGTSLYIIKRTKENSGGAGMGDKRSNKPIADSRSSEIAQRKVGRLLRDELSDIISSADIKANNYPPFTLLAGVSVPEVEFSNDFSYAKVYISVTGNSVEKRQVYVWLCNNIGQVRHSLSQRLRRLRRIPDFRFSLVDSSSRFYLSQAMEDASFLPSAAGADSAAADGYYDEADVDFAEADGEEFW